MMLKPRVMDPRQRDDISEALAFMQTNDFGQEYRVVPSYLSNWYPAGLKERTVGVNSRQLVGMTRYYPEMGKGRPPVIVDFEPAPPEPFFEAEKRRFCIEKGIVYVAIYLGDRMDESGFKERVKAALATMDRGHAEFTEDRALASVSVEDWLQTPELMAAMNAKALELLADEQRISGKFYRGVSRTAVLRRIKQQLVDQLRGDLKSGRIVDPLDRYRQPASAAQ